jgi:hypothetical protein
VCGVARLQVDGVDGAADCHHGDVLASFVDVLGGVAQRLDDVLPGQFVLGILSPESPLVSLWSGHLARWCHGPADGYGLQSDTLLLPTPVLPLAMRSRRLGCVFGIRPKAHAGRPRMSDRK